MPRKEGRVLARRNHDPDWTARSVLAQWLYDTLLSQPGLSYCGVIDYTPKRWAELAGDATPRKITSAVNELAAERFVLVDHKTEELLIRTLMKNDGVVGNPNLEKAARRDFLNVHSPAIRAVILEGLPQALREGFAKPSTDPLGEGSRERDAGPPPLSVDPSSSSPLDDDEDRASPTSKPPSDVAAEAFALIADARLRARIADRGPVDRPGPWLKTTTADVAATHAAAAAKHLAEHPDWPAHRLAAELEPDRFANDPAVARQNALESARNFGAMRAGLVDADDIHDEIASRFADDELRAAAFGAWREGTERVTAGADR